VALHPVGVAVELGDAGQALDLVRYIKPERLLAERQARYDIDLAQGTPCDGRSAKPCTAWKKPNGSLPSRLPSVARGQVWVRPSR
jgi:hypothetical protein